LRDDLPLLLDRIREHLDAPFAPTSSDLAAMELTLTDGYAEALELEAARARAERKIGELAAGAHDPVSLHELRERSDERTAAEADLQRLRALLELLRRRVDERRALEA